MTQQNKLTILAQWLVGEFENVNQAKEQPNWFVHIRLWHRLLPIKIDGNLAIFAEQAPILKLDQPYRQRILFLKPSDNPAKFIGQYYGFKDPNKFRGAGTNPHLLNQFLPEDLVNLPGCALTITEQEQKFIAQPEPGAKCFFEYDGQIRQVVLGLEVSEDSFKSFDRGVDPETGKGLWGALIGPYEYQKIQGFSWPN
ncbi:chromophore lyase CpcT/CpeT [Planktothricoides raciborskii]|uniref:Chromophore lyase CpcT/CpeT n=1 Tax=Planktothricoides raciborskii GIHE-MW2 TaxID=2792601 RepID=A0AAU8J772_9CYAN